MSFTGATREYEQWLGGEISLLRADLNQKHKNMRDGLFPFFRATYYRWAQVFPEVCAEQFDAPRVLGTGDLHVENFGTWRDIEGRLVWGINDFDEAGPVPYLLDIIRLLTSVQLAGAERGVGIALPDAIDAFLGGYREYLQSGGEPIVLEEKHPALRTMAVARLKDRAQFWKKLSDLPLLDVAPPDVVQRGIRELFPGKGVQDLRYVHRTAGLGSLGRRRFAGIGHWRGGLIAREAKELAPSASVWAGWGKRNVASYQKLLDSAVRCADPFVRVRKGWVFRRLAPDCSRIELASLGLERDERRLLQNMGRETANVHLADGRPKRLLADLNERTGSELLKAVKSMAEATRADWTEWKRNSERESGK